MKVKIGVVADDVTGANDIGIMFAKAGLETNVYPYSSLDSINIEEAVTVIDTNSRLDSREDAYKKVYTATKRLMEQGVTHFYNKTCSVFRGNIGAEFDAMMDALSESFAVVVLGFPDNGRTTVNSIHYVKGVRLEDSQFKNDPVNPMKESSLINILSSQTNGQVTAIHKQEYSKGTKHLERLLKSAKNDSKKQYVIFDVENNQDLELIADTIKNQRVICGASAIAYYTGKHFATGEKGSFDPKDIPSREKGRLIIAGSLTKQTYEQIEYMRNAGVLCLEFKTVNIFDDDLTKKMSEEIILDAVSAINKGGHVIIHTSNTQKAISLTKEIAIEKGLGEVEASKKITGYVADIAKEIISQTAQRRIIIAGGETSSAFCEAIGVVGMRVYREIQSGLPSCITLGENPMWVVLKSGSFGSPDFFQQAIEHLS